MEKISREIAEIKNNKGFAEAIAAYINKQCESSEEYQVRVNLEEKKLEECLKYIMSEVKKACGNASSVAATDEEVFKLVDDYYTKKHSEIKIETVHARAQAPKVETEGETYTKVDAPEKVEKPKLEKKSILTKKVKERDPLVDNQVSLFDLLG